MQRSTFDHSLSKSTWGFCQFETLLMRWSKLKNYIWDSESIFSVSHFIVKCRRYHDITFQIMIGTQQLRMLTARARPESWHRTGESRCHCHPAWCRAWSGRRSAAARWRYSRSSWRWSSPTCPCCYGSGRSSRRRGRWGGWCHTATGGWTRWTRTTWPSYLVWVPGGSGTSGRWTRWTRLCEGLPSLFANLSSLVVTIFPFSCYHKFVFIHLFTSEFGLYFWPDFSYSYYHQNYSPIMSPPLMCYSSIFDDCCLGHCQDILESCDSQSWVGAGARGESRAGALAKLPPSEVKCKYRPRSQGAQRFGTRHQDGGGGLTVSAPPSIQTIPHKPGQSSGDLC